MNVPEDLATEKRSRFSRRSSAAMARESSEAAQPTDATHGIVTITRIKVTLQLNITIWAPAGATEHVIDHEAGHRQISNFITRPPTRSPRESPRTTWANKPRSRARIWMPNPPNGCSQWPAKLRKSTTRN